ncbi:hypothetical protein A1O1_00160 [Capronia coronata CBS 617.96]|uniref:Histone deacetylation protein Rxt3 n=1 Tax=Capronia coronata CBS 617.96 TaxID=1182541 RepID=W9YQ39_9EURO|nr:uncharacterized protein A1O1_00160 [Capronia coronata CBS 617.96]EXJ95042.1 hypothetical protein A1O1_00160 [Capronia coronata CBS 617.96]
MATTTNGAGAPPPPPPLAPHKRPGSSMSISSMLGTEPERAVHEVYPPRSQPSRTSSRQPSMSGPSMSLGALMSPPQYPSKPTGSEYPWKPRSTTPDRIAAPVLGPRQHRSNSGTMAQHPGSFYEPVPRSSTGAYPEPRYTPPFGPTAVPKDEFEDRARRTSISGILQSLQQRPDSQPQPSTVITTFPPATNPHIRPESIPPALGHNDRAAQPLHAEPEHLRPNGLAGSYDTRPPAQPALPRFSQNVPAQQPGPSISDRPVPQSLSPEMRRPQSQVNESRGLAGLLNQQLDSGFGAQSMMRQDSVQSQSERSIFGDRLRNRPYSPFAGSVASQTGPLDDQLRKGSDEMSQHRTVLGLANESKRGRYSPVPQAVQGAQAQTPQPDAGIKAEHGRVFSGIGSGLGSTSAAQTPTPQPLSASPFKRDEAGNRLSEENLMKMSRSASGISKRNRKALDEDARAESDMGEAKKTGPGRGKRSKHHHSYKMDLEDSTPGAGKNTASQLRRAPTPTSNPSQPQHHHHHLQRQPRTAENTPSFRPRKIIRISSVVALARRNPRRHLGFFTYDPEVGPVDLNKPGNPKFDVAVRPNLLPSFTEAEHINCTYTVRVPRIWLRRRERGLICQERYLWGSGIYTDDSDPVAAAMHAGFITSVLPPGIDEALLQRVIEEQNPRIEGGTAPEKPMAVDENKDLHITLLVLPQLECYVDSVRFGIKSRRWPDEPESPPSATTSSGSPSSNKTPHDGVSFMVLKTEFVDDGVEVKRVGRTGKEKRKRLYRELMERKRGFELEKQKIEMAAEKARMRKEVLKREGKAGNKGLSIATSDASEGSSDMHHRTNVQRQSEKPGGSKEDMMKLDVGQSPGDWIRQLAVAAA